MKFRQGLLGRSALAVLSGRRRCCAAPTAASAETVVVEGNHRVDAETIRSYFAGGDSNEGVKKLYDTGYFSDVQVSRRGGALVVRVDGKHPIPINHVVFVGNSKVKSEELAEGSPVEGSAAPIARRWWMPTSSASRTSIAASGRNAATVSARTVETPNGTVDVVFDINEGEKTGIKEISFVGNRAFSTSKLLGLMETTEMNYLSFFKTSDVYDPDRIAKDAEVIRRYYLKNGYADFHVIGTDAVYDPAAGGYISRSRSRKARNIPWARCASNSQSARRFQRGICSHRRRPCRRHL